MSDNQLPVIEVPVNDEKLRAMLDLLDKYKNAMKDMPKYEELGKGYGSPLTPMTSFGGTGAKSPLPKVDKVAHGLDKAFGQVNKTLGKTTSELKNLFQTTVSWGAKLSLLASGGILGYDLYARHVAKQLTGAQGLGMTTGQVQAAHNVYGTRIDGVDNVLQGLASAQNDVSDPAIGGLLNLGIRPTDGAVKNLPKLYQAIYDLTKNEKDSGLAYNMVRAYGLDGVISPAQMNQIDANGGVLPGLAKDYQTQSQQLSVPNAIMQSFQALSSKFSGNADSIGNTFLETVARLNGPIGKLSDALTKDLNAFMSGPNGEAVFDTIGEGLESLAHWLGSASFKSDMRTFADDVEALGKATKGALQFFHLIPGDATGGTPDNSHPSGRPPGSNPVTGKYDAIFTPPSTAWGGYHLPDAKQAQLVPFFAQAEKIAKLPKHLLGAVAQQESGGNPFAVSPAGAMGLFQFMKSTGNAYGLHGNDFYNPEKSTIAAAKYLHDLMNQYHGDVADVLAQYNGGSKAVDSHGNLNMNLETVKYLQSILPKVEGAEEQHPELMAELAKDRAYLENPQHKGGRVHVKIEVVQKPGSDINVDATNQQDT